ncbi:phosphoribosyltransferase [Salinigranum halophilum]|jgi:predicted phosphoribosyltransferase|uniref:phosphoribosyltransferase n=1 Tax=Salinigranum halophilum TaxID=2565931 RepID=UPI00115EE25A|nr:phosphoribosyltransferase [Salinigranum halophilum]
MFDDRTDAGRQLADLIEGHDVEADVVLAIPRGGLPVGRAVADALAVPLDIVAARKLGAPGNPEFAIGAVASDGTVFLNDEYIDQLGVDESYVDDAIERERAAAQEKVDRYRGDRPPLDLHDKTVVVVDDGVATGATTIACLRQIREAGAARVVLAVPVGPPDTIERLGAEADEVLCVETPPSFMAVGQFYASFTQVSDDEAMRYLD